MIIIIIFGSVFLKVRNVRRISTLLSSWQLVIHSAKKKKKNCFPLAFPQLTWAYWQHDSFLVKKGKWVVLELPCFQWLNLKKLKRMLKSGYGKIEKNGRASHHSPIRLNSKTRRTSILRVTAGFFFFCFLFFFCFIFFCHWLTNHISIFIESLLALLSTKEGRINNLWNDARKASLT